MKIASALLLCAALAAGQTWAPVMSASTVGRVPAQTAPKAISAPSAEQYIAVFAEHMDALGIDWQQLNRDDPFTLIINSAIVLEVIPDGDAIASICITAQGDGSAHSGEIITDVMTSAVLAHSTAGPFRVKSKLLELISQTSGEDTAAGLRMSLDLSAESLELTLIPTGEAPAPPLPRATRGAPDSLDALIACTSALLPEGWTQTSYQGQGEQADVLLNIYTVTDDPDALWDCAHTVLANYWQCVSAQKLSCGRLSLVFYSANMTPLLSLGIGRADALECEALLGDSTTEQLIAELERLAEESDALVVRHYSADKY